MKACKMFIDVYNGYYCNKYKLTHIEYKVTDCEKIIDRYYRVTIEIKCTSDYPSIDSTEKSLLAYEVEEYVPDYLDSGEHVNSHRYVYVNDDLVHSEYYGL